MEYMARRKGNAVKDRFRRTREWKEFRSVLIDKANGVCECCGTKSRTLQVHHKDPEHYTDLSDPSKFAVLCRACHSDVSRLERIKMVNWCKYNKDWVSFFGRFILST